MTALHTSNPPRSRGLGRRTATLEPGGAVLPIAPHLSKSRYVSGVQCAKRPWLEIHRRDLATPPSGALQQRLETGTEIGRRAHELFPGGVLIDESHEAFDGALAHTQSLLADPEVPALFEPAFEHRGVRIRVDILERLPEGRFRLVEAKSGSSVKAIHLDDLAVQQWVLEGAGISVAGAWLLHINRNYVLGQGGIHWPSFFACSDQSAPVASRVAEVGPRVEALQRSVAGSEPSIEPGPHCKKPYDCPFWAHCTQHKPVDWVGTLPSVSPLRLNALREQDIESIVDIPADFPLSAVQARIRAVLRGEAPELNPGLQEALGNAGPPFFALDFETMGPAIPIYPGTHPYQRIPFQWSLHRVDIEGQVSHQSYLADGRTDPRREVAERLLEACGTNEERSLGRPGNDPILVWSGFEAGVIGDLAHQFPQLAPGLQRLRQRLVDLLPILREHVYKRELRGSFSLKRVAPALVPGFTFDDLPGVAAGADAALAFELIARGEAPDAPALRRALELYCHRDTGALVQLRGRLGYSSGAVPGSRNLL